MDYTKTMRMRSPFLLVGAWPLACLTALALLVGGCVSLPNLQGFADETSRMSLAIQKGYVQGESALARVDTARARKLKRVWKPTQDALTALVAYSDALASLSNKANDNAKGAAAFAGKFQKVTGYLQGVLPLSGIGSGEVSRLVEIAARQLILIKAQKTLSAAVRESQPVMEQIVKIIDLNLAELAMIHSEVMEQQISRNWLKYSGISAVYEAKMDENKKGLNELAAIAKYRSQRKRAFLEEIELMAGPDSTLTKRLEDRERLLTAQTRTADEAIKGFDGAYKDYQKINTDLTDQMTQGRALVDNGRLALGAWIRTHDGLSESLSMRQSFSLRELATVVQGIEQVYEFYNQGPAPARPTNIAR